MTVDKHGGHLRDLSEKYGFSEEEILDYSVNVNPLGFPSWTRVAFDSSISRLERYPDIDYLDLRKKIASKKDVPIDQVVITNGTSEAIYKLPLALKRDKAIIVQPTYSDYKRACDIYDVDSISFYLKEEDDFVLNADGLDEAISKYDGSDLMVFACHPNNPTGRALPVKNFLTLIKKYHNVMFIIDEAYIDFTAEVESFLPYLTDNMIILRSLTKIYSLPGLRMAYAIAKEKLAVNIRRFIPPWSLNSVASDISIRALDDDDFLQRTKEELQKEKVWFQEKLSSLSDLKLYPTESNFILCQSHSCSSNELVNRLLKESKIAIRNGSTFDGLKDGYVRIAIKDRERNSFFIQAISQIFSKDHSDIAAKAPLVKFKGKTPSIMFLGTGSNVGKSILTAGLCRILCQDGYKVTPFKAQNMALNSFVTKEGGEIGRAQAVQAVASKVDIDVRMNPILLKPTTEQGSQVILHGKPLQNMDFRDYSKSKEMLFNEVKRSYDSLAKDFDVIVMEGAGSVSEVNLKKNDIVNLRMAQYANAASYLVADIDRGGVFGSFVGSMATMEEWERKLIRGFVINKFRGIKSLLNDGVSYLQNYLDRPVVGVVPHVNKINIPDEDSVGFKSGLFHDDSTLEGRLDIVMIDLPLISNLTDIDPLRLEPDVRVRIVKDAEELGDPDLIVIPGSKNVLHDLQFLRNSGLFDAIKSYYRNERGNILGICGGYQILGNEILDPHGLESKNSRDEGLGLLPIKTTLDKEKTLGQMEAYYVSDKSLIKGYEIHHGVTSVKGYVLPCIEDQNGRVLGITNLQKSVLGTYLHGVFDMDQFRRTFLDELRMRKGIDPVGEVVATNDLDSAINNLADHMREHMNLDLIYKEVLLS